MGRFSSIGILCVSISASLSLARADDEPEVVTVTAPPSIPSNEPEWKQGKLFTSAILNSTNTYRAEHNATDLSWNTTLADFADAYLDSDDVGDDCAFEHSGGPYGENLAIGYPNVTASVEAWGNERDEYDFEHQGFDRETGHFTQLVWQNTTDVGCGRRLCGEKGWYLVCEYWPVGNVEGQYEDSVMEDENGGVVSLGEPETWFVVTMVMATIGSLIL
jgi:hypothetical protein